MKLHTHKKIITLLGVMTLIGAPSLFAASMTVTNDTTANVPNNVTVSASSGNNTSTGARGARGGMGGSISASSPIGIMGGIAGEGVVGGADGMGGNITTGSAIATAVIRNDINTTDTTIEDMSSSSLRFNETQNNQSSIGSSQESSLDAQFMTADLSSSSQTNNSTNTSNASGSQATLSSSNASTPYSEKLNGNLIFAIGNMAPKESKEITFYAKVKESTPGTAITNTVVVQGDEKYNNKQDNTDTTTITTMAKSTVSKCHL